MTHGLRHFADKRGTYLSGFPIIGSVPPIINMASDQLPELHVQIMDNNPTGESVVEKSLCSSRERNYDVRSPLPTRVTSACERCRRHKTRVWPLCLDLTRIASCHMLIPSIYDSVIHSDHVRCVCEPMLIADLFWQTKHAETVCESKPYS